MPPLHPLALTALDLSRNAIDPQGFDHLPALAPSLVRLSLASCQLKVVPLKLAALSRLTYLDLSGNAIMAGSSHLRSLLQLAELEPPDLLQHLRGA